MGANLPDLRFGKEFLNMMPKAQVTQDQIRSVTQSLSRVRLFATPWIAARLSITNSWSSQERTDKLDFIKI